MAMRFGAMSGATTVDLTDEIFEQLARSGEMPPYLADLTDRRGDNVPADTDIGSTN
jgi:hypothetical protein